MRFFTKRYKKCSVKWDVQVDMIEHDFMYAREYFTPIREYPWYRIALEIVTLQHGSLGTGQLKHCYKLYS